jgi:hypothetical protein
MTETGVFLPTLYRLVARNQLQRPAALFIGQHSSAAEKLLASGTVAEYRQELLNWGMTSTSLNANRMMMQRILFLFMQNLMLEEEKLGPKCAVPSRFKGDTSESHVRQTLMHSIVVLNSGTIWDLKEELQAWGLLHEHLNSGRLTLCILLKLSVRNLELSNVPCCSESTPLAAALTPPKHQTSSPTTVPAAKRLCVETSDNSYTNAHSHSISPVLLCAALKCASQLGNGLDDTLSASSSQSQSNCASSCSTQPRCDEAVLDPKAAQSFSLVASSGSGSPVCSHDECRTVVAVLEVAASS